MPETRAEPEHAIDVAHEATGVVLTIQGRLDAAVGRVLVRAAAAAIEGRAYRLDIDLRSLTGYTGEGAGSLVACRELCGELRDGLHYRTGQGPGADALLAAYADQD
jgi:anti-anti-sigma regulatory factor